MRRIIDSDLLTLLSRLLIGGIFVYASFYKILEPATFAKSIWFYHMVPGSMINQMAIILPWLELICGLGLILGFFYRGAVLIVNLMTLMFLFALGMAISQGLSIDCGCFKAGQAGTEAAWEAFWFDIGMLVFTLQLLISRSTKWRPVPSR